MFVERESRARRGQLRHRRAHFALAERRIRHEPIDRVEGRHHRRVDQAAIERTVGHDARAKLFTNGPERVHVVLQHPEVVQQQHGLGAPLAHEVPSLICAKDVSTAQVARVDGKSVYMDGLAFIAHPDVVDVVVCSRGVTARSRAPG